MIYYGPLPVDPGGDLALGIANLVAHEAAECGYDDCGGEAVGAAVHEVRVLPKYDPSLVEGLCKMLSAPETKDCGIFGCRTHNIKYQGYGSNFLPVCERHKGWEFAKYEGDSIYL